LDALYEYTTLRLINVYCTVLRSNLTLVLHWKETNCVVKLAVKDLFFFILTLLGWKRKRKWSYNRPSLKIEHFECCPWKFFGLLLNDLIHISGWATFSVPYCRSDAPTYSRYTRPGKKYRCTILLSHEYILCHHVPLFSSLSTIKFKHYYQLERTVNENMIEKLMHAQKFPFSRIELESGRLMKNPSGIKSLRRLLKKKY
jgi:hypothetical protein